MLNGMGAFNPDSKAVIFRRIQNLAGTGGNNKAGYDCVPGKCVTQRRNVLRVPIPKRHLQRINKMPAYLISALKQFALKPGVRFKIQGERDAGCDKRDHAHKTDGQASGD